MQMQIRGYKHEKLKRSKTLEDPSTQSKDTHVLFSIGILKWKCSDYSHIVDKIHITNIKKQIPIYFETYCQENTVMLLIMKSDNNISFYAWQLMAQILVFALDLYPWCYSLLRYVFKHDFFFSHLCGLICIQLSFITFRNIFVI